MLLGSNKAGRPSYTSCHCWPVVAPQVCRCSRPPSPLALQPGGGGTGGAGALGFSRSQRQSLGMVILSSWKRMGSHTYLSARTCAAVARFNGPYTYTASKHDCMHAYMHTCRRRSQTASPCMCACMWAGEARNPQTHRRSYEASIKPLGPPCTQLSAMYLKGSIIIQGRVRGDRSNREARRGRGGWGDKRVSG